MSDREERTRYVRDFDAARMARRRARRAERENPWTRLVFGLAVLAAGVLFWLDHQGRLDAGDYIRWWPLAVIAFGLAHLITRRWVAALVWVAIGLLFLPHLPGFPHFNPSDILGIWPLLISAAGVTLILQALRPLPKDRGEGSFQALAFMGGSGRTVTSEHFVGGDVVVAMGAAEIDLSLAKIDTEAVIDVLTFWGGVDIRVPRGWRVETHVAPLLGGISDRTVRPDGEDGPRLIIRGSAIMGGIEVKNTKERTA